MTPSIAIETREGERIEITDQVVDGHWSIPVGLDAEEPERLRFDLQGEVPEVRVGDALQCDRGDAAWAGRIVAVRRVPGGLVVVARGRSSFLCRPGWALASRAMTDERQSQEELDAHYGPGGPVHAAHEWVLGVRGEGDVVTVWERTAPALRRRLAESWVDANAGHPRMAPYDRDELIEALCSDDRGHPLWPAFEEDELLRFAVGIKEEVEFGRWGYASRPRPIGPDQELVLLADTGAEPDDNEAPPEFDGPTAVYAYGLLMSHGERGWQVADVLGDDDLVEIQGLTEDQIREALRRRAEGGPSTP